MALQDDVDILTAEVQAREPFLTSTSTGFDGNPNDPGAPAVIQAAPLGTWYHRSGTDQFYRKNVAGVWELQGGTKVVTEEPITVTVDADALNAAPRPPVGTVFASQGDVTDYLASQSGSPSAFANFDSFYDFLPIFCAHDITINTFNTQRPSTAAPGGFSGAFVLQGKQFLNGVSLTIQGDPDPDNWEQVHGGGVVRSHQMGSLLPFITSDPATFPNDGSLKGQYVYTDNGFLGLIWRHDDQTVWLMNNVCPLPIDNTTTFTIRRPSSIFVNSQDGLTNFANSMMSVDLGNPGALLNLLDCRLDGASNSSFTFAMTGGGLSAERTQFDAKFVEVGPADGIQVALRSKATAFQQLFMCSVLADETITLGSDFAGDCDGEFLSFWNTYMSGHKGGWFNALGALSYNASILDGVAESKQFSTAASLEISDGGNLTGQEISFFRPGVRSKIINTRTNADPSLEVHALRLSGGGTAAPFASDTTAQVIEFDNLNQQTAIEIGPGCTVDFSFALQQLVNGPNPNAGIGFGVTGARATLAVNTNTDLDGAGGGAQIAGATTGDISAEVFSLAELTTQSPLGILSTFNSASRT